MRSVGVGETVVVYFNVELTGGGPALSETGGVPQALLNTGSWSTNGFSSLASSGYGRYYANLDTSLLSVANGDVIQTRYQGPATKEAKGDTFIVGEAIADPISISCYGSLNEANTYFANMLNTRPWDSASNDDRWKSLRQATQMIDRLNFAGEIANEGQVLQFPRAGDTSVPEDIKFATYHIAMMLLDGFDPEIEQEKLMTNMNKYQAVQSYYDRSFIPDYRVAGIPSAIAWGYLRPYLRDSRELTLVRA